MCSDVDAMHDQPHGTQEEDGAAPSRRAFLTAMTMAGGVAMAACRPCRRWRRPPPTARMRR